MDLAEVTFEPLRRRDFEMLTAWLEEPLVARWWNHESTAGALDRDFGPSVDGFGFGFGFGFGESATRTSILGADRGRFAHHLPAERTTVTVAPPIGRVVTLSIPRA